MERMVEAGAVLSEMPSRMGAARARLSTSQPHRLGARPGRRSGRGGAGFGLAHHGAVRARTKPSDLRCARLSPRSARRRNQRSPEARSVDLHWRGRRADGARVGALGRRPRRRCARRAARLGEPLWGEQDLYGVDPQSTPRTRPGDEFDDAGRAPITLATKRRSRASGSSPCSAPRQSRSTTGSGRRGISAGRCGWRSSNSKWRGVLEYSGDRVALRATVNEI